MKFETSNSEFLLPFLIVIGISVLFAIYILRHKKEKIKFFLYRSIVIFLIIYFPIVEYWSIWTSWSIWPNDFSPENQSILSSSSGIAYGNYPILNGVFNLLSIISELLLTFSIILFISLINTHVQKNKILNWIPLINIFSIGIILSKVYKFKWSFKIIVIFWALITFMWVYYRFLAFPLYLLGIDSITILDKILFPDFNETQLLEDDYIIGYTYLADILKIILPALKFISGLLTLIIVKKIQVPPPVTVAQAHNFIKQDINAPF
ncbi:hypothetical protein CJ739_2496 [Mariniflexile rhizosphaerae]|uniref:hypothetical protein n=1 Tax=unclassified Mariniflexile TaxID=2643887 RepID=UPI000E335ED5|nr:hypothetical protein [Mariniflexile sp. TRM1-10]AXP81569.1 hypothetical protein CJ739_2496 [Mariniflexile sp. TRM1-10]